MSEAAQPKPKKLRTWSAFGEIRKVPSEYEVVTHDTNYSMRAGRAAPFESNPTTPANIWYRTYRENSPLKCETWNGFRDPAETTYRKYVTQQDGQEAVLDGVAHEFSSTRHDAQLDTAWVDALGQWLVPQRFVAHALQMTQAYLGTMAPSSYITNAAAFGAADLLRRVSRTAYRTRQLQIAHPGVASLFAGRATWEDGPAWQEVRKVLEYSLVAYDWAEGFCAVNLVLRPALDELLLRQFGRIAETRGDGQTWLVLSNLLEDSARHARWSVALAQYAIAQRPENRDVLARWGNRWLPMMKHAIQETATAMSGAGLLAGQQKAGIIGSCLDAQQTVWHQSGLSDDSN